MGYITPLFLVTWMSVLPFHGSDSSLWAATNLYFQNFLYFGKLWPKYQVSILTMSPDIYFQIFLVNSIFYLFLKGAATVKNYIPSYVPMNHLMPLETRPKEMAYQIHFRFKQFSNSFWKEWLGGVSAIMRIHHILWKMTYLLLFILISYYAKSFDMKNLVINTSLEFWNILINFDFLGLCKLNNYLGEFLFYDILIDNSNVHWTFPFILFFYVDMNLISQISYWRILLKTHQ